MKTSKFSDAQKAFIIKQGEEGTPVAEICRKAAMPRRRKSGLCPSRSCYRLLATASLSLLTIFVSAVILPLLYLPRRDNLGDGFARLNDGREHLHRNARIAEAPGRRSDPVMAAQGFDGGSGHRPVPAGL